MKVRGRNVQVARHRPHRGLHHRIDLTEVVLETKPKQEPLRLEEPPWPEPGAVRTIFDEAQRKHKRR